MAHPETASAASASTATNVRRRRRRRRAVRDSARGIVTVRDDSTAATSAAGRPAASSATRAAGGRFAPARTASSRSARAEAGRRSRSFSVACSTTRSSAAGTPGATEEGAGTRSVRCLYAMATEVSPENGGFPVSSSNITTPVAYRSVRGSAGSPWICSGARYWTVPVTVPSAWLMLASANARASPKSATFTVPSPAIRMFSGFTSRCTMPCPWAWSSADRTCAAISTTWRGWRRPYSDRRVRRLWPRTYSMTMKYVPSVRPQSYTPTMFGWLRMAAARASRRNRSTNPRSPANCGCRTLSATSRPSTVSSAR